ncbi:MAG: hypothetical protein V5A25_07190, partial [Halovenus sp.]
QGNGNGSVIEIESDDVAIVGPEITGVGTQTRGDDQRSDDDSWDSAVDTAYGRGDAGIVAADVSGTYIHNVSIETPAVLFSGMRPTVSSRGSLSADRASGRTAL